MKTLELRPEGPKYHVATESETPLTFREMPWRKLVTMALDCSPKNAQGQPIGFTPDLMRKRLRILEAVTALPDDAPALELEHEDAKQLAAAVLCMPWARVSQWNVDFCDAVAALAK